MPAFSAATTQLTAKDTATNDVIGIDDVSAALSKGMLASELASIRAYLGSTQENADTSSIYYEPIARRTTGTPATGFGYGWRVTVQTDLAATPNTEQAGSWRIQSTDLTGASEDWKWVWGVQIAGAASITDTFEVTKDGANVPSGKVYQVAGTQVVGAQGAAIPSLTWTYTANDPGTTANSATTFADGTALVAATVYEAFDEIEAKINAILAALRAHGLIAT